MLHNQSVAPTLGPTAPVMVALTTSFVVRPTMAVLSGVCPPNWTNNNTFDCINATMDNGVGIGGTSASFTGFPEQDGAAVGYDVNYSLPRDGLFDFEMDPLERVVSTIVPVFFGIIGLAGLLGNALVILVVVANQQMRSTTNLLIINLAISDILFVIFCVPFTATDYVLPEWPFGNLWCKFVQYMIVVTCHGSVYTLVLMSLDRFLAVVHPVTSMSLQTERNAIL